MICHVFRSAYMVSYTHMYVWESASHAGERGLVQRAEGTQQLKIQLQKPKLKYNKKQKTTT